MDQNNRWTPAMTRLLATLAVLLIVFVAVKTVGAMKALPTIGKSANVPQTIAVNGKGEVFAKPDIATFNFGITEEAASVSDAQSKANQKVEAVLAYLEKSGVESKDIQTTAYNIYPRYEYNGGYYGGGKQILAAYVSSQSIEVKVRKLEDAGKILSGVGEFGATDVSGLSFSVDAQDALAREARDKAIVDARDQAEKLAKSLGVKLGGITAFYENAPYQPMYYAKNAAGMRDTVNQSSSAAQIPTGENKITSNVTVTYEIR